MGINVCTVGQEGCACLGECMRLGNDGGWLQILQEQDIITRGGGEGTQEGVRPLVGGGV